MTTIARRRSTMGSHLNPTSLPSVWRSFAKITYGAHTAGKTIVQQGDFANENGVATPPENGDIVVVSLGYVKQAADHPDNAGFLQRSTVEDGSGFLFITLRSWSRVKQAGDGDWQFYDTAVQGDMSVHPFGVAYCVKGTQSFVREFHKYAVGASPHTTAEVTAETAGDNLAWVLMTTGPVLTEKPSWVQGLWVPFQHVGDNGYGFHAGWHYPTNDTSHAAANFSLSGPGATFENLLEFT